MEFQKLIEARRSVRKYSPEGKVSREDILTIIKAAQEALPGMLFLDGLDNGKNIVYGYHALLGVFAHDSSCFDQLLKFHDRSSSLSRVIFMI